MSMEILEAMKIDRAALRREVMVLRTENTALKGKLEVQGEAIEELKLKITAYQSLQQRGRIERPTPGPLFTPPVTSR